MAKQDMTDAPIGGGVTELRRAEVPVRGLQPITKGAFNRS